MPCIRASTGTLLNSCSCDTLRVSTGFECLASQSTLFKLEMHAAHSRDGNWKLAYLVVGTRDKAIAVTRSKVNTYRNVSCFTVKSLQNCRRFRFRGIDVKVSQHQHGKYTHFRFTFMVGMVDFREQRWCPLLSTPFSNSSRRPNFNLQH